MDVTPGEFIGRFFAMLYSIRFARGAQQAVDRRVFVELHDVVATVVAPVRTNVANFDLVFVVP